MSIRTIKKLNTNQLLNLHAVVTDTLIKKIQKEYDDMLYKNKAPNDKLECQICGGCYTRQKKAIHDRTKRHQERIGELYGGFYETESESDSE